MSTIGMSRFNTHRLVFGFLQIGRKLRTLQFVVLAAARDIVDCVVAGVSPCVGAIVFPNLGVPLRWSELLHECARKIAEADTFPFPSSDRLLYCLDYLSTSSVSIMSA
jgi:hypothetical protein